MSWRCLRMHAAYRCQHSGVCCTANWQIPAEPQVVQIVNARGIGRPGDRDALFVRDDTEMHPVLARRADGACVFFENDAGRLCAIHRIAGHDALPSACRHFPREMLIDRRGTFVSLSHFCPTAAGLLLTANALDVVDAAPPLEIGDPIDGLDATGALAPLVRPGMLCDLDGYDGWERACLAVLSNADTAQHALDLIAAATEEIRDWRPDEGPLLRRVAAAFRHTTPVAFHQSSSFEELCAAHFPPSAGPVPGFHAAWDCLVEPYVRDVSHVMCNYIGARAFGNWIAYQGRGLRTVVEWLRTCLAVLDNEIVRRVVASRRPVTVDDVISSAKAADLLLLHTVDSQVVASCLDAIEGPEPA